MPLTSRASLAGLALVLGACAADEAPPDPPGASFAVDFAELCADTEECPFDRPLLAGGGLDLFVTLHDPARDPLFDLTARSADVAVLAVEATLPQGDVEIAGERIYVVAIRGVAPGTTTLELVSAAGEVIARTPVEVAAAAELIVHVAEETPRGADGVPEIAIGDSVYLWAEPRDAAGEPLFAGDGPAWSIPGTDVAVLLTEAGDAATDRAEATLLAGNAAGTVTVSVTVRDATAMQPIRIDGGAGP